MEEELIVHGERGAIEMPPERLICVSNKTIPCAGTPDGKCTIADALRCFSTIPDDAVRRVKKELGLPATSKISDSDSLSGSCAAFQGRLIVCHNNRPLGLVFYAMSGGSKNVFVFMQ